MSSLSDSELLRHFSENDDQSAFTAFVSRHVNLVYSTAVRQLAGDTHLAQDVVQAVFTDSARKARSLAGHRVVSGWLYLSACYAAAKLVRSEQRRRRREVTAHTMNELTPTVTHDAEWNRFRPVIDDALQKLRTEDREALLLRFFESCAFAEIGARLQLSENAARMRVDRALEKLRLQLARRGITSTAAAVTGALTAHAVVAAPATLAGSVASAALSTVASAGSVTLLQWLVVNKITAVSAASLLSAAAIGVHLENNQRAQISNERNALLQDGQKAVALHREIDALRQTATEVATLRNDDAELDLLNADAAALRERLESAQNVGSRGPSDLARSPTRSANPAYNLSDLDEKPKLRSQPPPKFPANLRRAGVSGEVVVSLVVDAEGKVNSVHALKSTHIAFEAAALQAVQLWTFTPGMKNGAAVPTTMVVPIQFNLTSQDTTWF